MARLTSPSKNKQKVDKTLNKSVKTFWPTVYKSKSDKAKTRRDNILQGLSVSTSQYM